MEGSGEHPVAFPLPGNAGRLAGTLGWTAEPAGLVIFAHGSGSSRLSPRNRYVAHALRDHGFATLLFDLLTEEEAVDRQKVFDIPLLASRLAIALDWCRAEKRLTALPICLFGASTGAAAALVAAADKPEAVAAVVSRGGRPDLADDALERVRVPTLLIVGGEDHGVIELNQAARARLGGEAEMRVIPGATHLFEEPGALDAVVRHAADWYATHLAPRDAAG